MRVRLPRETQRALVDAAHKHSRLPWKALAHVLNVGERYLRTQLRNGDCTLREGVFEKLCTLSNYPISKKTIVFLDDQWGRGLGGKNAPRSRPQKPIALVNEYSENLAEFMGILSGDGNCYELPSKGIYQMRIVGQRTLESEYINGHVSNLFRKLFSLEPSIYVRKKQDAIVLSKQSKSLVFTLKEFGFSTGNKKTNGARIPEWIFNNREFLKAFFRGFVDTDGSIYPKTMRHRTPPHLVFDCVPNACNRFSTRVHPVGLPLDTVDKKEKSGRNGLFAWQLERSIKIPLRNRIS